MTRTPLLVAANHDLRQPLQAASMFVEALEAGATEPRQQVIIAKLRRALDDTQGMLNAVVEAARLDAGLVQPHKVAFPVAPLLADLAEAGGEAVRVASSSLWIHSDPALLHKMLTLLLDNALRFAKGGGVLLGCRRRGGAVEICVVDSGPGIPADQQDAVFQDFVQLGGKGGGGLGLGLGLTRRLSELLLHPVALCSVAGRGTCFSVKVGLAVSTVK